MDEPEEDEDRRLARHILKTNYAGEVSASGEKVDEETEEISPVVESDILRKYIAFARRNCHPRMTGEARDRLEEFYVDLRTQGGDEDTAVPVTARKLEALIRLAEASAKVRLSDDVELEDAERAIKVTKASLEEVGRDPETGEFDIDRIEAGQAKSQRDRIKKLQKIIDSLSDDSEDDKAHVNDIIDAAEEAGIEREKAAETLEMLKKRGEIIEPNTDFFRNV